VVDNEPLELQFSIPVTAVFDMDLMESSFDLISNPKFKITKRLPWMMPTPFVLNDAVVIQKKIVPSNVVRKSDNLKSRKSNSKDSLTVSIDTLKGIQ
jgi:hypothetical protein